jgi:hypothetical protein
MEPETEEIVDVGGDDFDGHQKEDLLSTGRVVFMDCRCTKNQRVPLTAQ